MQSRMIGPRHHAKILDAVVRLDAIDVMNIFRGLQFAPKMLLHHLSMLKNPRPVGKPNAYVSGGCYRASADPVVVVFAGRIRRLPNTASRTISMICFAGYHKELCAAIRANSLNGLATVPPRRILAMTVCMATSAGTIFPASRLDTMRRNEEMFAAVQAYAFNAWGILAGHRNHLSVCRAPGRHKRRRSFSLPSFYHRNRIRTRKLAAFAAAS